MRRLNGFTLIELFVVMAMGGLAIAAAIWILNATVARTNDARRVADVQNMVVALAAAAKDRAVLCDAAGAAPCAPGSLLHECTIYRTSCNGKSDDQVTAQYLDMSTIKDPMYDKPCRAGSVENCAYTFLEVENISKFVLGFTTQGSAVQGLSFGHTHRAEQKGFVR